MPKDASWRGFVNLHVMAKRAMGSCEGDWESEGAMIGESRRGRNQCESADLDVWSVGVVEKDVLLPRTHAQCSIWNVGRLGALAFRYSHVRISISHSNVVLNFSISHPLS